MLSFKYVGEGREESIDGVFEKIKSDLSMKEVAGHYGLDLERGGMVCCPFHEDNTPSMKVYEDHYHCFGCGEHGDATSFVARMFGLRQIDAARKLSEDFGLRLFDDKGIAVPVHKGKSENQKYRDWLKKSIETVTDYVDMLYEWKAKYAPHDHFAEPHKLFTESIVNIPYAEYISETLRMGYEEDKKDLYHNGKEIIDKMQERLSLAKGTLVASHRAL